MENGVFSSGTSQSLIDQLQPFTKSDKLSDPHNITTEVTNNIEEAIKSVTGLEMRVSVVEPDEGGPVCEHGGYDLGCCLSWCSFRAVVGVIVRNQQ